jgi:hypothetical protein
MKTKKSENIDHKIFRETFRLGGTNLRRFLYAINNSQFSINERRILKAYYLYKKNKKNECLELLQGKTFESEFLEGVRLYLIGLVYNQFGHLRYAIENLRKSVERLKLENCEDFIINPLSVLAIAFGNRRELSQMEECYKLLKTYKAEDDVLKLQVYHVGIVYNLMTEKFQLVHSMIDEVNSLDLVGKVQYQPYFLIIKISAYVRSEDYQSCLDVLETYKKESGNLVKANYAYIKILLDHIVDQKPLYIYASHFAEFPELFQQLQVIKNLSIGDIEEAEKYWLKLSIHNQALYKKNFNYQGETSLFSKLLDQYRINIEPSTIDEKKILSFESKIDRLDYILKSSTKPISSHKLIELIWDEEADEKNMARLRKLISLYSKKYNAKINSRQMTYQLIKKAS